MFRRNGLFQYGLLHAHHELPIGRRLAIQAQLLLRGAAQHLVEATRPRVHTHKRATSSPRCVQLRREDQGGGAAPATQLDHKLRGVAQQLDGLVRLGCGQFAWGRVCLHLERVAQCRPYIVRVLESFSQDQLVELCVRRLVDPGERCTNLVCFRCVAILNLDFNLQHVTILRHLPHGLLSSFLDLHLSKAIGSTSRRPRSGPCLLLRSFNRRIPASHIQAKIAICHSRS
mmetsp:Transcript_32443/g.70971  ORF Transcript_32443/g.70971 Transcript_32443/m.70971 type:complete len:229 (-) Transcript_32443:279-965(-)